MHHKQHLTCNAWGIEHAQYAGLDAHHNFMANYKEDQSAARDSVFLVTQLVRFCQGYPRLPLAGHASDASEILK